MRTIYGWSDDMTKLDEFYHDERCFLKGDIVESLICYTYNLRCAIGATPWGIVEIYELQQFLTSQRGILSLDYVRDLIVDVWNYSIDSNINNLYKEYVDRMDPYEPYPGQ